MMTLKRLFSMCVLLALAACGGGGGGAGTSTFGSGGGTGGGGTTTPTTPTVSTNTITLSISSTTVTASSPATVTVTLKDSGGAALPGKVINVATARTGLATLSAGSLLTDNNGAATVTVLAASGGLTGADELVATASATSGTTTSTVSASIGFNVTGAAATIATTLSPNVTTLRTSTSPVDFIATLRDPAGQPLANQVVSFKAAAGLVTLTPASALTDATGQARTKAAPASASTNAAETLSASTTVNGRDLQSSVNVQLVAESPSITLTLSSSNVSATAPATVRATVLSAAGTPVAGAVVSFSSQFNLASFNPATASTDANGVATSVVSPRLATTTGADLLRGTVTVGGITRFDEKSAQFTGTTSGGTPVLQLALSSSSISAASPATVTATLSDARGVAVSGQVVTFAVVRGLARTNITTSLTDAAGRAVVVLSPASPNSAGADEITASASYAGVALSATQGFQVQATSITLDSFAAADNPLSAYGQTTLTLGVTGASVTSPVNVTITSACVSLGKATLSPATLTVTGSTATMQYRDNGCGAVQTADQLQAVVTATGVSRSLALTIQAPAESSIAFVQAAPESIFLRGSGFTESSVVTFEVRDAAGNALPGKTVELRLQTGAGGVTMEGRGVESVTPPSANPFTQISNASGRVAVRVNSGTQPTPVRIHAKIQGTTIATVSSNLSVAVGLPSQLNFSLSQGIKNIEGYNIDGTTNTYQIIAADRSGNPVPAGTSINFVTEGGQIEAIKQTQLVNGIARTTANFVSAEPRPVDGRVTITSYALGEESFVDLNGNNIYDSGEPFQDLGNVFKDRNFDGSFDATVDEYIPLAVNNRSACAAITNNLLALDPSIPSAPATCDGVWSGAGQVYVRRAVETVLSTSAARPLWGSKAGLSSSCSSNALTLQTGPLTSQNAAFIAMGGDTWYAGSGGFNLPIIVADANPGRPALSILPRLNPMAAGTLISASTPTTGLTVQVGGGTPVPSTTEASAASVAFSFSDPTVTSGVIFITFTSPSGVGTTVTVPVTSTARPTTCP
jgi:protocatechuate 3,4-dioxygenase beta subunit